MELNIAIELYPILSFLQLFENVCTTVISCKSCQQSRGPIQPAEHWCDSLSIIIRLIPAQDQTSSAAGEDMRSEYEYREKKLDQDLLPSFKVPNLLLQLLALALGPEFLPSNGLQLHIRQSSHRIRRENLEWSIWTSDEVVVSSVEVFGVSFIHLG
jgi:hypothetical protein